MIEQHESAGREPAPETPLRDDQRNFAGRLLDIFDKLEWVRASAGKHYVCPLCGAIAERDGGPGHAEDCERIAIVAEYDRLYPPTGRYEPFPKVAALRVGPPPADETWTPTAEHINALPLPVRSYIHQLETDADPAGKIRELVIARDVIRALEAQRLPTADTFSETIKLTAANLIDGIMASEANFHSRMDARAGVMMLEERLLKSAGAPPPAAAVESTRVMHARKQGAADGFQDGWHAALQRISQGDGVNALRDLVPIPKAQPTCPRCFNQSLVTIIEGEPGHENHELMCRACETVFEPSPPPAAETPLMIAERIARSAHEGQKDTVTGAPYITHVERVVALVEGDDAKAVAWLHDVLEDSPLTSADLARAGIPDDVREAVERLTRGDEPYSEYISTIHVCGPALARVVKIADLRDHLHPSCPERLRSRYEKALNLLVPPPAAETPKGTKHE